MPAIPTEQKPVENKNKPSTAELDQKHKEEFAKISPEDLKKQQDEFLQSMFGEKQPKPEKKDEPKPEEPPKEEKKEETKPEEKPAETPADEKTEKPPVAAGLIDEEEPARGPSPEAIVIDDPDLKVEPPAAPAAEELPDDDLNEEDRQQLAAAAWLAKNDQRFAGRKLDKELKSFWDKEEARARKWEKEHEGETYDPAAAEHAEFYRKNQPPLSEADLQKAAVALTEERVAARVEEKTNKRLEEMEAQQRIHRALPVIERRSKEAVAELVEQILPGTLNGAKVLTKEIFEALSQKDPVATEILNEEAVVLRHQIKALETMVNIGTVDFDQREKGPDGRSIFPVRDVSQAGMDLETKILELPEEKRQDGSRKFVPRMAYNRKYQEIVNGPGTDADKQVKIAQLDARYWTIQPADVRDYLVKESSNRVKKQLARIPRTDKKEEKKGATVPTIEQQNGAPKSAPTAPAVIASTSDNVDTTAPAKKAGEEIRENLRQSMWS